MKEELLKKDEKEAFEYYINHMMMVHQDLKKEDFEFTKMMNYDMKGTYILRARIRNYIDFSCIGKDDLKGMQLGVEYTWKELGLYGKGILDDKEREYLSAVIKPFKKKILTVEKAYFKEKEWLFFTMKEDMFTLPYFKKGTMYSGMKKGKKYTLKELGL